jgi:hypothetical protein
MFIWLLSPAFGCFLDPQLLQPHLHQQLHGAAKCHTTHHSILAQEYQSIGVTVTAAKHGTTCGSEFDHPWTYLKTEDRPA